MLAKVSEGSFAKYLSFKHSDIQLPSKSVGANGQIPSIFLLEGGIAFSFLLATAAVLLFNSFLCEQVYDCC